jgi:DNA-binding IclR family transcriptional regulator
VERAAAILRVLAGNTNALKLSEISVALQLPKGTAHGILRTLVDVGFVEQDRSTGRYTLGPGLSDLHSHQIDGNELRARSMNWADPLAARVGEAVRVGVLDGTEVLVVHYVFRPDGSRQSADVGARLPGHATALGKALLAYQPAGLTLLPARLIGFTPRTVRTRRALAAELGAVRDRGFAVDYGEYAPDRAGIAAPITAPGGLVVGAVAVHGALDRLCDTTGAARPAVVTQVLDCAHAVARELANEDPWPRAS